MNACIKYQFREGEKDENKIFEIYVLPTRAFLWIHKGEKHDEIEIDMGVVRRMNFIIEQLNPQFNLNHDDIMKHAIRGAIGGVETGFFVDINSSKRVSVNLMDVKSLGKQRFEGQLHNEKVPIPEMPPEISTCSIAEIICEWHAFDGLRDINRRINDIKAFGKKYITPKLEKSQAKENAAERAEKEADERENNIKSIYTKLDIGDPPQVSWG